MTSIETVSCLVLVGCIWGVSNPLMKRGSIGIEKIKQRNSIFQFLAEIKFLVSSWRYVLPFLFNISGSAIYYFTLGTADLSIAVPITNSLAFIFTSIAGRLLGEKGLGKSGCCGILLVILGITLCVLDKSWAKSDKN